MCQRSNFGKNNKNWGGVITFNNCHIGWFQKLVLIDADETLAADTESIFTLSNKQSAAAF